VGITRRRKGGDHTLAALKSTRASRPDGYRLYVILDNLSANKTPAIRTWAKAANVELCFTPHQRILGQPEAQPGPLRTFVMGASDHPNHTVRPASSRTTCTGATPNARHPDILAAQRRERARIRIRSRRPATVGKTQTQSAWPGERSWSRASPAVPANASDGASSAPSGPGLTRCS
jgi:hypothetical protein